MNEGLAPSSSELAALSHRVLRASWAEGERDGVPYAYTRPSPARYPWQWYWDSCFAAIVWRRFDRERSRAELETLLRACRPDGFVGHVIFWDHPISLRRRVYYNVASRSAPMTGTIQPPLLAWAWRIAVGDPAAEPRIARHHEWLVANRDLDGDGLLWLVQPDESGLDSSPKFDPVWGRRAHARLGFPLLVARNRRLGWDARRVRDAGGPVLCEVVHQRALGARPPGDGRALDHPGARRSAVGRAAGAVPRRGAAGRPAPRRSRPGPRWPRSPCPTCRRRSGAAWSRSICWTRGASGCRCHRPRSPPRSGASSRDAGRAGSAATGAGRPGSTPPGCCGSAWSASATAPKPRRWRAGWARPCSRQGLREYYHPRTGEGLGATDFAWTSLILEMADPANDAPASYLDAAQA